MDLAALIKSAKAALAATDDPKKIATLSAAIGSYSAALEAWKKTEKFTEKTKSEEGEDDDEDKDEDDSEEDAKSDASKADDEASASAAASDDSDDDEDDAKSASKALALVQALTGEKGAAGRGKLRAIAMFAAKADERLATLEKKNKADEKSSLIASVTGKFFTPTEAKDLAAMPLNEVRSLVAFAKKRGALVHTEAGELLHPKAAAPGTVDALPEYTRKIIDEAVAAHQGDKKKHRAMLEAAHLEAHTKQIAAALNGASEGRY
jgi:hypothetical protein